MALPAHNPELYQVDFAQLNKDTEFNRRLKESLACISNSVFDESYLKKLATEGRTVVYVLADTSWNVLCALQVYLEGSIDGRPSEDEEYGVPIHRSFKYFKEVPEGLCGARIVHLFAPQNCNASTSINLLTKFYNGEAIDYLREEGPLVHMQRNWQKLYYLGVCKGIDAHSLTWENLGFSLLFVGYLQTSFDFEPICSVVFIKTLEVYEVEVVSTNQQCALSYLARISRGVFVALLARLRALPPAIAIRFIKSFAELIPEEKTVEKLWGTLDDGLVSDFIAHPSKDEVVDPGTNKKQRLT